MLQWNLSIIFMRECYTFTMRYPFVICEHLKDKRFDGKIYLQHEFKCISQIRLRFATSRHCIALPES